MASVSLFHRLIETIHSILDSKRGASELRDLYGDTLSYFLNVTNACVPLGMFSIMRRREWFPVSWQVLEAHKNRSQLTGEGECIPSDILYRGVDMPLWKTKCYGIKACILDRGTSISTLQSHCSCQYLNRFPPLAEHNDSA